MDLYDKIYNGEILVPEDLTDEMFNIVSDSYETYVEPLTRARFDYNVAELKYVQIIKTFSSNDFAVLMFDEYQFNEFIRNLSYMNSDGLLNRGKLKKLGIIDYRDYTHRTFSVDADNAFPDVVRYEGGEKLLFGSKALFRNDFIQKILVNNFSVLKRVVVDGEMFSVNSFNEILGLALKPFAEKSKDVVYSRQDKFFEKENGVYNYGGSGGNFPDDLNLKSGIQGKEIKEIKEDVIYDYRDISRKTIPKKAVFDPSKWVENDYSDQFENPYSYQPRKIEGLDEDEYDSNGRVYVRGDSRSGIRFKKVMARYPGDSVSEQIDDGPLNEDYLNVVKKREYLKEKRQKQAPKEFGQKKRKLIIDEPEEVIQEEIVVKKRKLIID